MVRMGLAIRALLALWVAVGCIDTAAAEDTTIHVGAVRTISNGSTLFAEAHGYFKEAGIKLEFDDLSSSANAIALLAQNKLQIVEGGISAGYFNALEKGLPIVIVLSRVNSPLRHNLMLRPDLKDKIKTIKDLKGKVIASNGAGSVATYEVGKILETAGLTLSDVEIKVIPFSQMAVAFHNKAVDAAIVIPPTVYQFIEQGIAVPFADPDDYAKPSPITISVNIINTDWAKQHPKVVRDYYYAYLRGVRDYCNAYLGGSIRKEFIDLLVKSGTERRPEILYKYAWPARDPNGRLNIDSLLDMQTWYRNNKFTTANLPASRLVDASYADDAIRKLGKFVPENQTSTLPGCR
jgi:NitT/TauT family transport system substrate-binding protein